MSKPSYPDYARHSRLFRAVGDVLKTYAIEGVDSVPFVEGTTPSPCPWILVIFSGVIEVAVLLHVGPEPPELRGIPRFQPASVFDLLPHSSVIFA